MVLSILEMVFPVLLMFGLGWLCNKKQIFSAEGLAGINSLVGSVLLPVVLFNAFFTAEYSGKIALTFAVVFIACALGLAMGFLLKRFVKPYDKFMPFLLTNFEGGMLGYALFGLLYAGQSHIFAMVDIGQTLAAYTTYLITLQAVSTGKTNPKALAKSALTNPAFIGTLLGVVLGMLGIGKLALASPVGKLITDTIAFVTAPVSGCILIIVGYKLCFRKELLKPVAITVVLRIVVMAILLVLSSLVVFSIVPFDKPLFVALLLGCTLPAPFIIPLFAEVGNDGEYISTALSMETVAAIIMFIGVAAYTLA